LLQAGSSAGDKATVDECNGKLGWDGQVSMLAMALRTKEYR